ncbi:Uu.00g021220.m01.CDS01 [Anthostomella pinea]|uniref:Uu.00g021220.m01.CDS01 n=1 Tax=Anthostomella pinea TaxID=933095 RepID=A0AAI8VZM7_9PEZI|nr:Uu.00g021220.m01.CDS01 [Anthostomella pinea]
MAGGGAGERKIRVGILGAGIAGTSLAIGLLQNPCLDVRVFESYPGIGVRGSGLALHGNAIRAMDTISPLIKAAYFRKSHYMAGEESVEMATQFILGAGPDAGTLVAELGRARGRRTVHRAHFIEGLLEDTPGLKARVGFGMRAVEISQNQDQDGGGEGEGEVQVKFADGTTAAFDVVLGAEGVKSLSRRYVLGPGHPAVEPVNHDSWRAIYRHVPMAEAAAALPRASIERVRCFCTPLGYVNGIPVDLGRTYTVGCYLRDDKRTAAGGWGLGEAFDKDEWSEFSEDTRALVELLAKNPSEDWKIQDHDPAPTYVRGGVAMLGDAAHATAPHAGNGAAQALEDAAVLTGIFALVTSASQIEAALGAYDAVRRPRSQEVVQITRRFGRLYTRDVEDIDVEDMRRQMREGGAFTNGVDMEAQVRDGVEAFLGRLGGGVGK